VNPCILALALFFPALQPSSGETMITVKGRPVADWIALLSTDEHQEAESVLVSAGETTAAPLVRALLTVSAEDAASLRIARALSRMDPLPAEALDLLLVELDATFDATPLRLLCLLALPGSDPDGRVLERLHREITRETQTLLQPLAAHALGRLDEAGLRKLAAGLEDEASDMTLLWTLVALSRAGERAAFAGEAVARIVVPPRWMLHHAALKVLQEGGPACKKIHDLALEQKRKTDRTALKGQMAPITVQQDPTEILENLRGLGMKIGGDDGHVVALPRSIPGGNKLFFGIGDIEEAMGHHLVQLSRGMMLGLERESFSSLDDLRKKTRGMVGLAEGLHVLRTSREQKK
jgi:hypothetical protein